MSVNAGNHDMKESAIYKPNLGHGRDSQQGKRQLQNEKKKGESGEEPRAKQPTQPNEEKSQ